MADDREQGMAEADEMIASAFDADHTGREGSEAAETPDDGMVMLDAARERLRRVCAHAAEGFREYRDLLERNGFTSDYIDDDFGELFGDCIDVLDDASASEEDGGRLYRFESFLDYDADSDEWAKKE